MGELDWQRALLTFCLASLGALAAIAGKLGLSLSKDPPPDDPTARVVWARRRWWLVVAELSTVPALASGATTLCFYYGWPPLAALPAGLVAGGVGLAFILTRLKAVIAREAERVQS